MSVIDDRLDGPGIRRIRPTLADVIAGLDQVPEVIDHAGAGEERALGVDRDAPGVARPLAPDLEDPGPGMDAEDRAGELVGLAILRGDLAGVEYAVPAVEPAVGAPGERVGQLVGVGAAEAGRDDFPRVGLAVAVAVLEEEEIGRVGDPDTAVADGDPRGDVQPVGKDRELIGLAVAVGVLDDLDPVAAWARLDGAGIPGSR